MIATISPEGIIVFDTNIQSPWDWIDMIRDCFPSAYIGCYDGYENCICFSEW